MSDTRTIAAYDANADDYAAKFDQDKPGRYLSAFMDAVPAGADVLDLGCGTGAAAAMMQAAGLTVTGLDASAQMLRHARARCDGTFVHGTFDDLNDTAAFDGVWANFSLLHAARDAVPRHLAAIARALRPGGVFHIGVKTGEGSKRDRLDRGYTYFSQAELIGLLDTAGFGDFDITTGHEVGLAGTDDAWIIVLGRKIG